MMVRQAGKPCGLAGCGCKPCSKAFISLLSSVCNLCIKVRLRGARRWSEAPIAALSSLPGGSDLLSPFQPFQHSRQDRRTHLGHVQRLMDAIHQFMLRSTGEATWQEMQDQAG